MLAVEEEPGADNVVAEQAGMPAAAAAAVDDHIHSPCDHCMKAPQVCLAYNAAAEAAADDTQGRNLFCCGSPQIHALPGGHWFDSVESAGQA